MRRSRSRARRSRSEKSSTACASSVRRYSASAIRNIRHIPRETQHVEVAPIGGVELQKGLGMARRRDACACASRSGWQTSSVGRAIGYARFHPGSASARVRVKEPPGPPTAPPDRPPAIRPPVEGSAQEAGTQARSGPDATNPSRPPRMDSNSPSSAVAARRLTASPSRSDGPRARWRLSTPGATRRRSSSAASAGTCAPLPELREDERDDPRPHAPGPGRCAARGRALRRRTAGARCRLRS